MDRHDGSPRPGLAAVQQISCKEQEPLMKTEHHHGLYMAAAAPGIKRPATRCDLLAQNCLFSGHFCHSDRKDNTIGHVSH